MDAPKWEEGALVEGWRRVVERAGRRLALGVELRVDGRAVRGAPRLRVGGEGQLVGGSALASGEERRLDGMGWEREGGKEVRVTLREERVQRLCVCVQCQPAYPCKPASKAAIAAQPLPTHQY